MQKQQQNSNELVRLFHDSIQKIIAMYRLIKVAPKIVQAENLIEYASYTFDLLSQFLDLIPKTCVPIAMHKHVQKENLHLIKMIDQSIHHKKQTHIEMAVLSERIKQLEANQKEYTLQRNQAIRHNKKRVGNINYINKKSEKVIGHLEGRGDKKYSLPRLEKVSLMWMMGGKVQNEKLVDHLMSKS